MEPFGNSQNDASSMDHAVVVDSVGEEYLWVQRHCPGFAPQSQALMQGEGKWYDAITLRNEAGEERTVYFDITGFFGK